MSVEAMAWVLNNSPTRGTDKIVLLGLANHADADGRNAYPSIARLARYANVTERAVQQALSRLEKEGHIRVARQAGGTAEWRDDRRPNLYEIALDGVKEPAPRDADGVKSRASRGEVERSNGVKQTSPKPYRQPSIEPSKINTSAVPEGTAELVLLSEPEPSGQTPAQQVVGHYVDAFRDTHGRTPPQVLMRRIGKDAKPLLEQGYTIGELCEAAAAAARFGHGNLPSAVARCVAERRSAEPRGFAAIRGVLAEEGLL